MDDKTKTLLDRETEIVAALLCDKTMECCGKAKQCPYHSTDYNHISIGYGCDVDRLDADTAGLLKAYAAENAQLREQLDEALMGHMATEANDPLTLEDLRGMDGEPVWVEYHGKPKWNEWRLVKWDHQMNTIRLWDNTGMWWRYDPEKMDVYLRPPEGGEG